MIRRGFIGIRSYIKTKTAAFLAAVFRLLKTNNKLFALVLMLFKRPLHRWRCCHHGFAFHGFRFAAPEPVGEAYEQSAGIVLESGNLLEGS